MGSGQLFSTPAFNLFRRALTIIAVTQFRGMNNFQTENNVQPNFAIDCNNVIVSDSGALEKMRLPVQLSAVVPGFADGPAYVSQFQYMANGVTPTRQVIANLGNSLYSFAWSADSTTLTPTVIQPDDGTNGGPWNMLEVNNKLFMTNGQKMVKWLGSGVLEQIGIYAPGGTQANSNTAGNAPSVVTIPSVASPTFAIGASGLPGINIALGVMIIQPSVTGGFDVIPANLNGLRFQTIPMTVSGTNITAINGQTYPFQIDSSNSGLNSHTSFQTNVVQPGGTGGGGTLTPVGTGNLLFGSFWGYAYQNSATGAISNVSAFTSTIGAGIDRVYMLQATAPPDPQVDTIVWYRSLDGGGTAFRVPCPYNGNQNWPIATFGLVLLDSFLDAALDTTQSAQFINNPPPLAKYLSKYQGRVIAGPLVSARQTFAWSGYEQIQEGPPEEAWPANNQINLSIGADEIAGHGAIMPGVVFWSRTGSMWMLRGALQDITQNVPVVWTDYLEELPWTMGAYADNTIQPTPGGLVWLAQDKSVNVFNGTTAPECISTVVTPLLQSITPGTEQLAVASYFNWLQRNWYLLLIAVNGSTKLNKAIFFALEASTQDIDVFPSDIQADFTITLQTPNGQRVLAITQGGRILQLPVNGKSTGGINHTPTSTTGELAAWWRSGYFGSDFPYRSKMFRQGVLLADNQGYGANIRLIDNREYTFRNPKFIANPTLRTEIIEVNQRGMLCSLEIQFPKQDIDSSVLELRLGYIGTADRQS